MNPEIDEILKAGAEKAISEGMRNAQRVLSVFQNVYDGEHDPVTSTGEQFTKLKAQLYDSAVWYGVRDIIIDCTSFIMENYEIEDVDAQNALVRKMFGVLRRRTRAGDEKWFVERESFRNLLGRLARDFASVGVEQEAEGGAEPRHAPPEA